MASNEQNMHCVAHQDCALGNGRRIRQCSLLKKLDLGRHLQTQFESLNYLLLLVWEDQQEQMAQGSWNAKNKLPMNLSFKLPVAG